MLKIKKMKIYVIADTHFNHTDRMVEYCARPSDYEAKLWKNLQTLPADCLLIHLGDFCIGRDSAIHEIWSELPYKKVLVLGNHDRKSMHWYMEHGWDFACRNFVWDYDNKHIVFSHAPIKIGSDRINIHGHLHNVPSHHTEPYMNENHILYSCEEQNYNPIELKKILC